MRLVFDETKTPVDVDTDELKELGVWSCTLVNEESDLKDPVELYWKIVDDVDGNDVIFELYMFIVPVSTV